MTNPMTAEEARGRAMLLESLAENKRGVTDVEAMELRESAATLRAYADMLDRQTVDRQTADREAVRKALKDILAGFAVQSWAANGMIKSSPTADRILALMPASDISPPAMSESGAVSTNNPNVAHMNHAKDGMMMVPREPEAAPFPWRLIEEAPKFRPLLGFASGVTFSMMWKSDNVELNKAIKKFLKHTPPLEPSGAGWCAYAYGQYCRKADGSFFFVEPTHFIPLSDLGIPGGEAADNANEFARQALGENNDKTG